MDKRVIVKKEWGVETYKSVYSKVNEGLRIKELFVEGGEMTSKHFHVYKQEVLVLYDGFAEIKIKETKRKMKTGKFYFIERGEVHRIKGLKIGAYILELSVGNDNDKLRMSDKYNRR